MIGGAVGHDAATPPSYLLGARVFYEGLSSGRTVCLYCCRQLLLRSVSLMSHNRKYQIILLHLCLEGCSQYDNFAFSSTSCSRCYCRSRAPPVEPAIIAVQYEYGISVKSNTCWYRSSLPVRFLIPDEPPSKVYSSIISILMVGHRSNFQPSAS